MNPLISVIVPMYNTAALLPRCVDSLLTQTHGNIEIILVDDGSSDGSGALCDRYVREFENITAIAQENRGVSAARNAGLSAAQGNYIGFVDSDDWIEPEMYSTLLSALKEHGTQIAACAYKIHRYDGAVIDNTVDPATPGCLSLEQALESLIHPRGIQGFLCNKLFDRELLNHAGDGKLLLLDERIHVCEDLLYVSKCIEIAGGVSYDSRPMYTYCVRDYCGTTSYNREKRMSEFLALGQLVESWNRLTPELGAYIKQKYTNEAYHILRAAAGAGDREYIPVLREHLRRYLRDFLRSKAVRPKRKVRVMLALVSPNLENKIAEVMKKH